MKITTIEAAVFQLETAIELWVSDADPVSITTLAFASHEMLYRLVTNQFGYANSLADPDWLPDHLPKEFKDNWHAIFKMDPNFCKHAGSDPYEVHHLTIEALPSLIFDTVKLYNLMGFKARLVFLVFQTWMVATKPSIFPEELADFGFESLGAEGAASVESMGKRTFYQDFKQRLAGDTCALGSPVVYDDTPEASP